MTVPRFYAPDLTAPALAADQAHHCRDVLRLAAGDDVELFDGKGNVVRCRLTLVSKREVRLEVRESVTHPPLPVQLTLAMAVIKRNMDFLVQKATELGVAEIVPLRTARTVARPDKAGRWREIALEACKQCGNNWLPRLAEPVGLTAFLAGASRYELKLVAALQPDAVPWKTVARPAVSACLLVGPEGDFTAEEYAAARATGFRPVTLGPLVLRADTAALYALSVAHHELVVHRWVE